MFDYNNEQIKRIIDSRNNEVIPLYFVIMGVKYKLLEINDIETFNPSGFKVGFGTSTSLFNKSSKNWKYIVNDVDCVNKFEYEDKVNNSYDTYYIFETSRFDDVFVNSHFSDMHKEINEYFDMIYDRIKSVSEIKHREKIRMLMESEINE